MNKEPLLVAKDSFVSVKSTNSRKKQLIEEYHIKKVII